MGVTSNAMQSSICSLWNNPPWSGKSISVYVKCQHEVRNYFPTMWKEPFSAASSWRPSSMSWKRDRTVLMKRDVGMMIMTVSRYFSFTHGVVITYDIFLKIYEPFFQVVSLIRFNQRRGTNHWNHLTRCLIGMKSCIIGSWQHMDAHPCSSPSFCKRWEHSPRYVLPLWIKWNKMYPHPSISFPFLFFNIISLWFFRLAP